MRVGVGKIAAAREQRIRVFLEEERRLALGIVAHLDGVVGIIAADAINAMNRETPIAAANGKTRHRRRRNHVLIAHARWY